MTNRIKHIIHHSMLASCLLLFVLLSACSETKNLAEGETLYVGINKINYDSAPKVKAVADDSTGVITAVANAYQLVQGVLTGQSNALDAASLLKSKNITKAQRDSLKQLIKRDEDAYFVAKTEVEGALEYAPNNSLLGSSYHRFPFPLGLWVYNNNVYKDTRWGRWMMRSFATTPVYMTTVNPMVRAKVAQTTLHNFGYFRGQVGYSEVPQKNERKMKVDYDVHPGPLFHLDSIAYQGFSDVTDSLIHSVQEDTHLHRGDAFSAAKLSNERERLSQVFRDHGYYYFQPSYITYRADTIQRPLHVQLQVEPLATTPTEALRQYHMGRTTIYMYDYHAQAIKDTLRRRTITLYHSGEPGKSPLKLRAMRRYFGYRKGDLYSQTIQQQMQQNLAGMGVFSSLTTRCVPRDSVSDTLDVEITARMDRPYDAEFKGNLSTKTNGLVGPGASFSMSKMNTFRGAETLSLEAHAGYEWQTGAQMKGQGQWVNSYEYGVSLNLHFPRLTMLGFAKRLNRKATASTTYKIDAEWMNRSGYFGRVSMGASMMYSYQRHTRERHEFTPFKLNYDMMLRTTDAFDAVMNRNQALAVSMRDQFIPAMQYAFTVVSHPSCPHTHMLKLTAKEAGNVVSGAYAMFGKDWKENNKGLFGVPFAQFAKLTAEYTAQFPIRNTKTSIAMRLFAGAVVSYGNSTNAPYSDLFSIGGANSIRAFGVRSIGPGSYNPQYSNYSYIDEMGDLKFEANLEYRFPLVGKLNGAIFVDTGNVWLMKPDKNHPGGSINVKTLADELALGTGLGVRYDLDFLVVRFDVGVGIHSPYDTGKSGYYNMTRFGKSLGYHIAIGYPF